jgi:hypothetical protein
VNEIRAQIAEAERRREQIDREIRDLYRDLYAAEAHERAQGHHRAVMRTVLRRLEAGETVVSVPQVCGHWWMCDGEVVDRATADDRQALYELVRAGVVIAEERDR